MSILRLNQILHVIKKKNRIYRYMYAFNDFEKLRQIRF